MPLNNPSVFRIIYLVKYYHDFSKFDPLANYVVTLDQFLKDYQKVPENSKSNFFYNCTCYITALCWKKMHRHIMHPISISFIVCLTQVGEDALQMSFTAHSDSIPITKCSDAMLGVLLLSMCDEEQIESIVMGKCTDQKFYSTLSHLLAAFEELINRKLEVKGPEGYEGLGMYNETICYEFHQLVVTMASMY
jgi:hypothetical protein